MTVWTTLRERGAQLRDAAGRDINKLTHPDRRTRRRMLAAGLLVTTFALLLRRGAQNPPKRS